MRKEINTTAIGGKLYPGVFDLREYRRKRIVNKVLDTAVTVALIALTVGAVVAGCME